MYCVSGDEKEIESMVGKTGRDIKWQAAWLGVSMRLLDNVLMSGKLQHPANLHS